MHTSSTDLLFTALPTNCSLSKSGKAKPKKKSLFPVTRPKTATPDTIFISHNDRIRKTTMCNFLIN